MLLTLLQVLRISVRSVRNVVNLKDVRMQLESASVRNVCDEPYIVMQIERYSHAKRRVANLILRRCRRAG